MLKDKFIENSIGRYNYNEEEKWWTDIFYNNAYEIVNERNSWYPITIPSYNRWEDPLTVKLFFSKMNSNSHCPVFVVVRESQKENYENALKEFYGVKVLAFPDEEISNIGATRRRIVRWAYDNKFDGVYMLDDDLTGISYTVDGVTKNEKHMPIAKYRNMNELEVPRIFAMWQLSMEKSIKEYNIMCNGISPMFSSWKFDYTDPDQSLLMRGLPTQCFCLNVKGLIENGIEYRDTAECGHEDLDLVIRVADKGLNVSVFPFLVYSATPMRPGFGGFGDTMEKRMKAQQEIMMKNFPDKEWVRFQDKRGMAQVSINWIRLRKIQGVTEYKFNIWNHGEILEK